MRGLKFKICFVLGTRPEIIKLYSVMNAARAHKDVTPVFIHTGQHYDYEMSQVFLEELKLPPVQHFLNVRSGSHGQQTAKLLAIIEETLQHEKPDVVIVVGDTNTTLAGGLAAAKLQIPVAHVEAGCRSFDLDMPEEVNRLAVDSIASIFFAPSQVAALNLVFEGKPANKVFHAGNTVVDIVDETRELRNRIKLDNEIQGAPVVVTLHRPENVDKKTRLKQLINALTNINAQIVFPVHPRTKKRIEEFELRKLVENVSNLCLVKPLKYFPFMKLLEEAHIAITDSGGVQEEAVMVGTPCVTARDTTEWPETVWAKGNHLAGTKAENITKLCNELLTIPKGQLQKKMTNPFKGNAGPTIIQTLVDLWKEKALQIPKPDMACGKYPLPWLVKADQILSNEYYSTLEFDEDGHGLVEEKKHIRWRLVRKSN